MKANRNQSKKVTSKQIAPHDDLEKILARYDINNYQRPVAPFSQKTWEEILKIIKGKKVIFDFGCGIGKSTFVIARENPDCLVIGIDKSFSRIDRQNRFKANLPQNAHLFRGELLDLIPLVYQQQNLFALVKVFFLYPNPWPKPHLVKRRFHVSPIAPFIFRLNCPIISRSNWKLYLEEFECVSKIFGRNKTELLQLELNSFLTPFEKKYALSGQDLYELKIL